MLSFFSRSFSTIQSGIAKPHYKLAKLAITGLIIIPSGYFIGRCFTKEYFSTAHTNNFVVYTTYLGNMITFAVRIFSMWEYCNRHSQLLHSS